MAVPAYEVLARSLRREGVDTIFYIMGGPMLTSEAACMDHGIRAIDVRHEQAAAMMAHAYSRVRNRPGVCMTAAGPGTLNVGTGLATSLVDCTPVVALGGSRPLREAGIGAFQEFDQVAALRPLTKWAERVYEARRIPELVNRAFRMAVSGKPGPVYLDLPGDLLHEQVEEQAIVWPDYDRSETRGAAGDAVSVERAIKLLAAAERPVLLWGSGALFSNAAPALHSFVDRTGIPFFTTPQSRGLIPEDHPCCYLSARNIAFREADVVLIVGTRINYVVGYTRPPRFSPGAKFIRVDIDPAEIATTPRLDLGIVGDARTVMQQLDEASGGHIRAARFEDWRSKLRSEHERRAHDQEQRMRTDQVPIHPLRLCKEARDFLQRDAILVVDGNEILNFGRQAIPSYVPGHRLNSGTFGTMGVGLPYALGAKAASPDSQVVCLHGDGSFGLNAMELDTAVRHRLPVITIISLNGGWTASDPERPRPGRDLGYTRFDRMAEALGCAGEYVERPEDIAPALQRASEATKRGQPALVNVKTDPYAAAQIAKFTTSYDAA